MHAVVEKTAICYKTAAVDVHKAFSLQLLHSFPTVQKISHLISTAHK